MRIALATCLFLATGAAAAQPAFPQIAPNVQAARDTERRTILLQEQADETKLLQAAEKTLASASPGEREKAATAVENHRRNLAALDAEAQRIKGAAPAVAGAPPFRLRVVSAAPAAPPAAVPAEAPAPFWDVYRRREPQPQPAAAAAGEPAPPYWDVFRRNESAP